MAEPLLRLEKLSKYYTGPQSVVMGLTNLNLSFDRGEFVAITGQSGSGKSTLGHVLGGILGYEGGELYFRGQPTSHFDETDYERYRRDEVSFISQNYGILPGVSVLDNVLSALRLSGMDRAESRRRARDILEEVELWSLRARRAAKLSSGQKQRLSIARALAKPGSILIADEPTGNLDPENSAKVIELLHRASRERLVLLITHEFSEAEGCATRRIELSDGQVVLDAALWEPAEPLDTPSANKKQPRLSAYTAALQLKSRPVWTALVTLLAALTAFAVFAFLGTFLMNLDDTATKKYDDSAFLNGDDTRVVVLRADGASMTEEDYDALLAVDHVQSLERYGYLQDVAYAWRENRDYKYTYFVQTTGDMHSYNTALNASASLQAKLPFLQTVPLLPEGETFLQFGRLPENLYEVVAAGDESLIGTTVPVFIQDRKNWNTSAKLTLQMQIVGVTDYGEGLYFHDDLGRAFFDYFYLWEHGALFLYAEDLTGDLVRVSKEMNVRYARWEQYRLLVPNPSDPEAEPVELKLICEQNGNLAEGLSPIHESYYNGYYQVSRENFERIVSRENSDQVSLHIADYAYLDRVLEDIRGLGYIALSPFREGSTKADPALAAERMQTLFVCAIALAAVVALQILVLRALFSMQTASFELLRNIGLTAKTAAGSIRLQMLLFTLLGQALALFGALMAGRAGIERIAVLLRHLPTGDLLILSAAHLAAAAIAASWIRRGILKRVFPSARRQNDMAFSEEVAE